MNKLLSATSPYLFQHANNPVDWYPWGEEAFTRAKKEEKPIFLSIGYSTCHWCHVMAHESFENQEIAAILNEYFICIKVDREERPDVDRLYMSYIQALTGSGGWPMSVWLTPDLKPFFGGTYFPPENSYGRVGFPSVLLQLAQLWKENRSRLEEESLKSVAALQSMLQKNQGAFFYDHEVLLKQAYEGFAESFDQTWGGFGNAPKFPRPSVLHFLLRYAYGRSDQQAEHARKMVFFTLDKMAEGGLQDHVGGGFHRYSVDAIWQVSHFEKMLYDQAQLATAYLEAWQLTGEQKYSQTLCSILNYIKRDLQAPEGGFYSAEDADSFVSSESNEKREGAFYVWTYDEIKKVLTEKEATLLIDYYGIKKEGNIPEASDPHGELSGKNVLMEQCSLSTLAEKQHREESLLEQDLVNAKQKLFQIRNQRPRPHLDDKIITAWNGLMISAFARAGSALEDEKSISVALAAAQFIHSKLYDKKTGKLFRSWRQGNRLELGFAEDYAFLIQGLLDLYEATADIFWLEWAYQLQKKMNELFWDASQGGYFSSEAGDPYLLFRMKEDYDGAEPSANSIAALNLLRFSRMLHDQQMEKQATQIFNTAASTLQEMPTAVPQLFAALQFSKWSPSQLVVVGQLKKSEQRSLLASLNKKFHPEQVSLFLNEEKAKKWLTLHAPVMTEVKELPGSVMIYQCKDFCCQEPVEMEGFLMKN